MKHRLTILTTAAVLLVSGGFARAAHTGKSPALERLLERLAELGVTPDQKAEAQRILRDHHPTVEPLLRSFVSDRRARRDLMHPATRRGESCAPINARSSTRLSPTTAPTGSSEKTG